MYLEQFITSKDDVLLAAMAHPAMSPKRKPTIETALKCVVAALESIVAKAVTEKYLPMIRDAVDMHEINEGEFETLDPEAKDAWQSAMDDQIEKLFEPLTPVLSADWLARYTIDTHMEEEDACDKLAASLGKEVFKQLSFNKEPGAVLSNAGILRSDVDIYFTEHLKPKQAEETQLMSTEILDKMHGVIGAMHNQLGSDFDIMEVMDEIDNVCDGDEILAGGSGQRLGLSEDDLNTIQLYVLDVGKTAAQESILEMLQNYQPGAKPSQAAPVVPPAPAAPAPAVPSASQPAAQTTAGAGDEPFNGARTLTLLKEHSSVKDTDMAAALGVSRSTYLNWAAGKTAFAPDDGQRQTLRNQLVHDLNALREALCNVDGVPFEREYE